MTITIDIGVIVTLITAAVGATAWIGNQLSGIRKDIQQLRETFVSHDMCHERRELCPCVQQLSDIKSKLTSINQRQTDRG